jgi:prepilin-type N-terminal cleavage/methylation domain-containing protein
MENSYGLTIIELLVAISIAGIVMTLAFAAYGNLLRGFSLQSKTANKVRSSILARKRIDRACNGLSVIHQCSEREIAGINAANNQTVTLRYAGTALLEGDDTICTNLENFAFTLEENGKDKSDRKAVLFWEGVVKKGGWIGGATVVRK